MRDLRLVQEAVARRRDTSVLPEQEVLPESEVLPEAEDLQESEHGPSPDGIGIDKVSFSFPIEKYIDIPNTWTHYKRQARGATVWTPKLNTELLLDPGVTLFVEVYWVGFTSTWYCRLEFNPARVVDPHGYGLCAVTDLPYTVGLAWDEAQALVFPACDLWEARLRRLDPARDGTCESDPHVFVQALARVPIPYAKKKLHGLSKEGVPETLYAGNDTTGLMRFYPKHDRDPAKAKPNDWRFEVEAYEPWLKDPGGMETFADVSSTAVLDFLVNRWEWAGMSTPIHTKAGLIDLVMNADLGASNGKLWTDAKKERFIGHLSMIDSGRQPPEPGVALRADFNKAIRELGVCLGPDLLATTDDTVGRLDFETGLEVRDAA
jgi:hypothetical protein